MTGAHADTIGEVLSSLADEIGDVAAIIAPGRAPLRFVDLLARVADVRDALARMGIGRGDRVVTALPHGAETAVCYFGVAACATYVPLNPDSTDEEFARYLARIRPKAVIVPVGGAAAIRNAATTAGVRIVDLHVDTAAAAGTFTLRSGGNGMCIEPAWADADDIALILLTSGTTADPKLVPVKHRHLTALARAGKQHYDIGSRDTCLHTTPMFHGHGLKSGLTMPVLAGSGVICGDAFSVPSFFDMLHALRPTWYSASYTMLQAILDGIDDYRQVARDAKLRFITAGSGRIGVAVVRGLEAAFGAPVLDRYSTSETGVLAAMPPPPRVRKAGTVGVPLLNEIRVADAQDNTVAASVEGEILARGPSVFEGYLDDPDANARAFVNGWFRTGDLGFLDDDGHLAITGRIKEIINQGGEKIAPAEVERAISRHPAVARVCVFGIPHPTLGEVVAAAVVPLDGALATERSIIEFAQGRLAAFKVPRCVLFTATLPLGPTGKTDRVALARQYASLPREALPEFAATPRASSSVESEVAQLWQELLDVSHVQHDLDFFLAGGDSLKATELALAVRHRFGVDVGMQHILDEGATVRGLARLVERERSRVIELPARLVAIKVAGHRPPLFAIPGSDGNPGAYVHFGRLLDARQPLYGLASRGFDGTQTPLDRMEDIAADHLSTIREFQPGGPYHLIGACFGARVAYEMARQLEAVGEHVAFLCLLDPSPPFTNSRGLPYADLPVRRVSEGFFQVPRFVARRLRMYADEFRQLDRRQRAAFVRSKLALVREIARDGDPFRGNRSELHAIALYEANQAAGRRYVPRPYGGTVIMALTDGRIAPGVRNYRLDWLDLMPNCGSPRYVPGRDTGDMLIPPNVQALAERVNAWLQDAHAPAAAAEHPSPRLKVVAT